MTYCLRLTKSKTEKRMKRRASWEREDMGPVGHVEGTRTTYASSDREESPGGGTALTTSPCASSQRDHQPQQPVYCPQQGWRCREREDSCAVKGRWSEVCYVVRGMVGNSQIGC